MMRTARGRDDGELLISSAAEEEALDSAEDICGGFAARGETIPEDVFHDFIEFLQGVFLERALVFVVLRMDNDCKIMIE